MSADCCGADVTHEVHSVQGLQKEDFSNDSADSGHQENQEEDVKLHEMGEALEIAENRCNTLKEQLDQMRSLYRERSTMDPNQVNNSGKDIKPVLKVPILRQNSEAITTDNSGAAVLTINNILNGITNSINRLSELHTYIEPEPHLNVRQKGKHGKPQENEFANENRKPKCSSSRSSSWIVNDKKNDKKKSRRQKSVYESGSLTHFKKPGGRHRVTTPRENPSTMSVKNRKKLKKTPKALKKVPSRRPGFTNHSSNHLVEIYHNSAVDYADSEELINSEPPPNDHRRPMRSTHTELRYPRNQVQLPTISTTDCKEEEDNNVAPRGEAHRSLSPIKEQEPTMEIMQQQQMQYRGPFFLGRSYQSPTISSKMKQVARGYFRHFACKSIPFCAAKSTSPSHNIGINIQQVMSIIKGRQSTHGISPTLAHNIGLAAERLNNDSFSAMVSTFGGKYPYGPNMSCPMQCTVNYQELQEMATEVPNDETLDEDGQNEDNNNKLQLQKCDESVCWTIDPSTHNNCTCANGGGLGFSQIVDKYQNCGSPNVENMTSDMHNSMYTFQPSMYSQKIQQQTSRRYKHVRSIYAQYNEPIRKIKKESCDNTACNDSPLQGKENMLKGVLINLHEEFATLSDEYDTLSKKVESEHHSDAVNVQKLESLEKKLNEKETEIQMVMTLYNEVVSLKAQVKALREKVGMSSALLDVERQRQKSNPRYTSNMYQAQGYKTNINLHNSMMTKMNMTSMSTNIGFQQYPNNGRSKSGKATAVLHLTKLLRQIQAYREVCKTGGK